MGYAEEAKVQLAEAKKNADAGQLAQVYATLALLESVDELASQVAYLSDLLEDEKEKAKQTRTGESWA